MPDQPFNNQRLFSDYYLASLVPTLPEWSAVGTEADEARSALGAIWSNAEGLVTEHEGQTEEHWIRPVLNTLGYSFQVQTAVPASAGAIHWPDYALFESEDERANAQAHGGTAAYFLNAVGIADAKVWDAPLDRGVSTGAQADQRNPNYQIDAYLRETDRRWGILTNGRKWRLYSRETSYRLDTFYEVDLIDLLQGDPGDFKYFWTFFRRQALSGQPQSYVDRVRAQSEEYAEALSARVKQRVYGALGEFINGFFAYPGNQLNPTEDLREVYESSLILLYRILFALYGEAHELLPTSNRGYRDTYSLARIKQELATRLDSGAALLPGANNYYADLKNLFSIINEGAPELGVPVYNGGLFDPAKHPFLEAHDMGDEYLARGLDLLARVPGADGFVFVDYKTLEIRHLGDIYEGLLEYHPRFAESEMVAVRSGRTEVWKPAEDREPTETILDRAAAGTCYLATGRGERRATGSYYTPQRIVQMMVDRSLGQVVEGLEADLQGAELVEALLELRVCDPAMGSGHFLVEVVDHLARAIIRAGAEAESPEEEDGSELLTIKRRVVERCVYGVDPNPLAVELAKLSLWLATVARNRPLSFLDAHLVVGDSLIGTSVEQMASLRGASNAQMNFVEEALGRVLPGLLDRTKAIAEGDSESLEDVEEKGRLLGELDDLRASFVSTANLWTARHFGVGVAEDDYLNAVTALGEAQPQEDPTEDPLFQQASESAERYRFLHWELEFPEIFLNPSRSRGFDVVVTNPPYVNAQERSTAYDDAVNDFWRAHFDSAHRAFDLYVLFLELAPRLTRPGGFASLITPNKFLSAPYAKAFREWTIGRHALLSLIDGSRVPVFEDPNVYPVITVFRAHSEDPDAIEVSRLTENGPVIQASHSPSALTRLPEALWAFLLLDKADLLLRLGTEQSQLEGLNGMRAVASTSAAEADAFGPHVHEEHLTPSPGWRMVITGTIRPYSGEWGLSRMTHQGRQFLRPVLPFDSTVVSHTRRDQYWERKLIFKKLCLHLEAVVDDSGSYASMNTNFVLPGAVDLFVLGALFHSTLMTWIYEGYFGALRMSGGFMQAQAPQLRVLPVPDFPVTTPEEELDAMVEAVDLDTVTLPTPEDTDTPARLYALLRLCGKQAHLHAQALQNERVELIRKLLEALGLGIRREEDPSFVLPRQTQILEAVETFDAPDLAAFWAPMRRTARQLGVEISPSKEQALLEAVHSARSEMASPAAELARASRVIDDVVYALYGLSEAEIAQVRLGHNPPPGITAEA